ncbi:hypothetical protein M422DRAFT_785003, partial [Sphaerobolus stellatus SS14]
EYRKLFPWKLQPISAICLTWFFVLKIQCLWTLFESLVHLFGHCESLGIL